MTRIDRIKALRNAVDPSMRLVIAARIVDAGEDHALIERAEAERVNGYTKPFACRNHDEPAETLTKLESAAISIAAGLEAALGPNQEMSDNAFASYVWGRANALFDQQEGA